VTVEFYDLAQRLRAAQTGQPVLQVAAALFTLHPAAILAEATQDAKGRARVTVGKLDGTTTTATGVGVLHALAAAGAVLDPKGEPVQLIVPDTATLDALGKIARSASGHPDDAVRAASALVGWWIDRNGYPGTNVVVNLLVHTRQRFITGAPPSRERYGSYWRNDVFAAGSGIAGLAVWAARVGEGEELAALAPIREDDAYSYRAAAERFAKGFDWSRPEPPPVAAMGLRLRCDTADLWDAALRGDRWWRHRAVHTGHVTGGEVTHATRASFAIKCPRLDSRLRPGSDVVGWIGGVDFHDRATLFYGDIHKAEAHGGSLLLTVSRVPYAQRPNPGQWVSLMPAPPNERTVRMGRSRYRRLLFKGDSWIASGKTPGIRRRDVPLDVLCAAAETE
jgi:hypothetical protein